MKSMPTDGSDSAEEWGTQGYTTVPTGLRRSKALPTITVHIRMPKDLKVAFFKYIKEGGREPSTVLRDYAAACVGWKPLREGIGGRPSTEELSMFRVERKMDYLISIGLSAVASPLQREIAIGLSREVPLELAPLIRRRHIEKPLNTRSSRP
jgi:hypothetical protein